MYVIQPSDNWTNLLAESFEWIPVSKKLPDEHDSIFAKLYETDVVNDMLWRTRSKEVLVTIEYENGLAWMPLPNPYKGNQNENNC